MNSAHSCHYAHLKQEKSAECGTTNHRSYSLLMKPISSYQKLKPIYNRYKASKDKKKFLRGFERKITLFDVTVREIKKVGIEKLPSAQKLKAELQKIQSKEKDNRKICKSNILLETAKKNVK